MRKLSILAATAAALAVAALAATSPAKADYSLIRWQDSGYCEIWDNNIPTQPLSTNYTTVGIWLPTFPDALKVKDDLMRNGVCSF
jgi:hypothetical protein